MQLRSRAFAKPEQPKKTEEIKPEPPKQLTDESVKVYNEQVMKALSDHVVHLSGLVESMIKTRPAITATIQRDDKGKMKSITITDVR